MIPRSYSCPVQSPQAHGAALGHRRRDRESSRALQQVHSVSIVTSGNPNPFLSGINLHLLSLPPLVSLHLFSSSFSFFFPTQGHCSSEKTRGKSHYRVSSASCNYMHLSLTYPTPGSHPSLALPSSFPLSPPPPPPPPSSLCSG